MMMMCGGVCETPAEAYEIISQAMKMMGYATPGKTHVKPQPRPRCGRSYPCCEDDDWPDYDEMR